MKKITIERMKNINNLEFTLPESKGVYLIVGPNGGGKTTLLVCIDRICNKNGFARGFSASRNFGEVDATIVRLIRERFFSDPTVLTASEEYRACNSPKPRKRAKQKLDLIIKQLSAQCGDSEEVVLDAFVEIFVSNALTQGQIKSIVAPMLQC